MARASRLHRGGWGFESLSAHKKRAEVENEKRSGNGSFPLEERIENRGFSKSGASEIIPQRAHKYCKLWVCRSSSAVERRTGFRSLPWRHGM